MLHLNYLLVVLIILQIANGQFGRGGNKKKGKKLGFEKTRHLGGYTQPAVVKSKVDDCKDDKVVPSISKYQELEPGVPDGNAFTVTSIVVDNEVPDTKWYIPSFHDRYSAGWNRTTKLAFNQRPFACHIRMYAIGLESRMKGFITGGTGEISIKYTVPRGLARKGMWREVYVGYDHDPKPRRRMYCYYNTNKHTGSEFMDKPKTLGIAIYCPITLDQEIGEYAFKASMHPGWICRPMMDIPTEISLTIVESSAIVKEPFKLDAYKLNKRNLTTTVRTTPSALRSKAFREMSYSDILHGDPSASESANRDDSTGLRPGMNLDASSPAAAVALWSGHQLNRPHSVVAVLTFRNPGTGPHLYMFVQYWYRIGWTVIIYDRFGSHRSYIQDMLHWPGFFYHPYTVYQLTNPSKYNQAYADKQGSSNKFYYKIESNWGYIGGQVTDLPDQDGDKTKTYDHARMEYPHLSSMLFLDIDELMLCPQANKSITAQRHFQRSIMDSFVLQGIQEMRFVRLPYGARPPVGKSEVFLSKHADNDTVNDFTLDVQKCMRIGFEARDPIAMLSCWSSATAYDNFYKSGDLAGVCPFHYNHWSCDGMKGGGRDWGRDIPRCRCKVGFDMMNGHTYTPHLNKCHLMHFHHNKYRFQSGRMKHKLDRGNLFNLNPMAIFLDNAHKKAHSHSK